MAAKLTIKGSQDLTIELTNFVGKGEYDLTNGEEGKASITINGVTYSTTAISTGSMIVEKYDAASNTVTGIFTFKGEDPQGTRITIVDGQIE